ncbi:MAG TPA: FAD:protein FMN transferase [Hyphomicrobium sp.]|nr:FAD:protein FMN transferase [Hyphomicrobium sp.]
MTRPGLPISRRRFIAVAAAVAGSAHLSRSNAFAPPQIGWRGIALGAPATLTLHHPNEREAKEAIGACLAELARLEAIFSLHRPDSALVRLNDHGRLDDAPPDLLRLLAEALALAERTKGAFDPTIQPVWLWRAQNIGRELTPQDREDFASIRKLVGWQDVHISGAGIGLARPGMALTLNGIAQGYITDKVGDVLRALGFTNVLVDMGEQLALGPKWDGAAWRIGLRDPSGARTVMETMDLRQGAVSTSSNFTTGGEAQPMPHILEPWTGQAAERWASVTVVSERATFADGLSTALSVLPVERWREFTNSQVRIYAVPLNASRGFWV